MKVRLMFPDADFDPELPLPAHAEALAADLGIGLLVRTMADGDEFLFTVCRSAMFQSLTDVATIEYRQQVLCDCLANPDVVRSLYDLAVEGVEADKHIHLGLFHDRPGPKLRKARECLVAYFAILRRLRAEIEAHAGAFTSPGLRRLCTTMAEQLPDDYLDEVEEYLKLLAFPRGTLQSVRLGKTNRSTDHVLRTLEQRTGLRRFLPAQDFTRHTVTVADRDIAGIEQLNELQGWGLAIAADAVSESADHVLSFFRALRRELGFYLGGINLHHVLTEANTAVCAPEVLADGTKLEAADLYDPLLCLHGQRHPIPNDVNTQGGGLLVITGANQGGKSTLLRALGLAQLMAQCGLFVPASTFQTAVATGVFTYFKREEDKSMTSGKFDEELSRMSTVVDQIRPGAVLLCNESFSSTNEREAAAVGGDVIEALIEAGVRVHLVTHLYELAHRLGSDLTDVTFLRADRRDDGSRSFRVLPGEPLRTSYGADLYQEVFGEPLHSDLDATTPADS